VLDDGVVADLLDGGRDLVERRVGDCEVQRDATALATGPLGVNGRGPDDVLDHTGRWQRGL